MRWEQRHSGGEWQRVTRLCAFPLFYYNAELFGTRDSFVPNTGSTLLISLPGLKWHRKTQSVHTALLFTDTEEFVKKCSQHKRVREFKITARLLESTQSIKVENLPDSISTDYLTLYFENVRNGGGAVLDVLLFPRENSAIITFCDHKGNTVLCLTKVLTGRWPARQLLQVWASGEAWLSVAEVNAHCPVPRKGSGCRNTAACLGLQCLLGVSCLFVLIPDIYFNTCLVHGFFALVFFLHLQRSLHAIYAI